MINNIEKHIELLNKLEITSLLDLQFQHDEREFEALNSLSEKGDLFTKSCEAINQRYIEENEDIFSDLEEIREILIENDATYQKEQECLIDLIDDILNFKTDQDYINAVETLKAFQDKYQQFVTENLCKLINDENKLTNLLAEIFNVTYKIGYINSQMTSFNNIQINKMREYINNKNNIGCMFEGLSTISDFDLSIRKNVTELLNILPNFSYLKCNAFKQLLDICNQILLDDDVNNANYIEFMKAATQLNKSLYDCYYCSIVNMSGQLIIFENKVNEGIRQCM